jgi:hypothetical protein
VVPSPPTVAGGSSGQALVNPPLIDSTIRRRSLGERAVIQIVSCATSQPDAPTGEAVEPDSYLPGAVQGAVSLKISFVINFTPLNVLANSTHRKLIPRISLRGAA